MGSGWQQRAEQLEISFELRLTRKNGDQPLASLWNSIIGKFDNLTTADVFAPQHFSNQLQNRHKASVGIFNQSAFHLRHIFKNNQPGLECASDFQSWND